MPWRSVEAYVLIGAGFPLSQKAHSGYQSRSLRVWPPSAGVSLCRASAQNRCAHENNGSIIG